jgi:hypothetical protein
VPLEKYRAAAPPGRFNDSGISAARVACAAGKPLNRPEPIPPLDRCAASNDRSAVSRLIGIIIMYGFM